MKLRWRKILAALFLAYLALPNFGLQAAMTSTNYQILWDSVGFGGGDTSSSSTYKLRDSFTSIAEGGSSTSYSEAAGFRGGVYDQIVKFAAFSQSRSSQVAATSLSGTTITVTTSSGYAAGDRIALVQDEGASQVVGVGKVSSVGAGTIVVDFLSDNGTAPIIDGANDYVYKLIADQAIDFGTLSTASVSTSVIAWEVDADVTQGYSVYITESQNLLSGSNEIADVADGSVSAGSSEFGARSSDTSLSLSTFDTQDTAISTTPAQIASRTDNAMKSRDFLTLKVAISSGQAAATYSNTLTAIFVGDY